jgi:endonuclease G
MNDQAYLDGLRRKVSKVVGTTETLEAARAARATGTATGLEPQAKTALNKLQNGDYDDLSPRELLIVEAIVEEEGRPVAFIEQDRFLSLPDPWQHFNRPPVRSLIEAVIPSIGRIEAPPAFPGAKPAHIGTGFLVGPGLIMTNRHVAAAFVRGLGRDRRQLSFVPGVTAMIDHRREKNFDPFDDSSSVVLRDVVMVHPYWDMALFRVEDGAWGASGLTLSVVPPEELIDEEVAVVGYPGRGRDRSAKALELERKHFEGIFGVKRLAPGEIRGRATVESFGNPVAAMTHDSSTLPGNSGSAIIGVKSGQVLGLHFAGITLKANYSVPAFELARDRRIVDAGVRFARNIAATTAWDGAWSTIEATTTAVPAAPPASGSAAAATAEPLPAQGTSQGSATWVFPLTIQVEWNHRQDQLLDVRVKPQKLSSTATLGMVEASFQIPIIYSDLESRDGYDPRFLELENDVEVPLPKLTAKGQKVASRLDDGTFELKYHQFSVVLHRKRRMALFTAANVNWQKSSRLVNGRKPTREELTGIPKGVLEEWVLDPRIPEADQLPDRFFTKDGGAFDKGHLVRRDDVAWGNTFEDMQMANGDTYHTTNCSPQVSAFNQAPKGDDNWGDLENMIQRETQKEKVIIFSGPVLAANDRTFNGFDNHGPVKIQIPRQFWKIVVANVDGTARAFGFLLKQKLDAVPLEFAVPEDWEKHHVSISEIESKLFQLVSLDWFNQHDALNH